MPSQEMASIHVAFFTTTLGASNTMPTNEDSVTGCGAPDKTSAYKVRIPGRWIFVVEVVRYVADTGQTTDRPDEM